MSGRSGYRKTGRKLNRHAQPRPKLDYVLRFQMPPLMAFSVSEGGHGWGITVGFNDVVFAHGQTPAHCAQLAADFLDKVGARQRPLTLQAFVVKLLPCSGHCMPARPGLQKIGADLEAIHDNISRNAHNRRPCSVVIGAGSITFTGATPKPLSFDFGTGPRGSRQRVG
jgi:hypothetical protein